MATFLTERENIRIEELCDASQLALEEAERDEVTIDADEAGGRFALEEVRDRARAAAVRRRVRLRRVALPRLT